MAIHMDIEHPLFHEAFIAELTVVSIVASVCGFMLGQAPVCSKFFTTGQTWERPTTQIGRSPATATPRKCGIKRQRLIGTRSVINWILVHRRIEVWPHMVTGIGIVQLRVILHSLLQKGRNLCQSLIFKTQEFVLTTCLSHWVCQGV